MQTDWEAVRRQLAGLKGHVRWLAFDAVGTLIAPQPSVAEAYWSIGRQFGSQLPLEEVGRRFAKVFRETEQNDCAPESGLARFTTSEEREEARWREIVARVLDDVAHGEACFRELHAHFARPAAWRCFDDVADALGRLAASGYRLAFASNFDGRLDSVRAGMPALRLIEHCVVSARVGARKPCPEFYRALCETLHEQPGRVLMVGDDWQNDIVGAREAGLPAVLLDRRGGAGLATLTDLADALC
ncbi:MAG TPA: HAD-IA family hydrolase [Planctomycetaceae bacterium]|nr:HAD-IA family hydrolase [Planctomycetaceae bacterium]